jgi:hypothetical protein
MGTSMTQRSQGFKPVASSFRSHLERVRFELNHDGVLFKRTARIVGMLAPPLLHQGLKLGIGSVGQCDPHR